MSKATHTRFTLAHTATKRSQPLLQGPEVWEIWSCQRGRAIRGILDGRRGA